MLTLISIQQKLKAPSYYIELSQLMIIIKIRNNRSQNIRIKDKKMREKEQSESNEQIPGTSSIVRDHKRGDSLVPAVWVYNHDPNDSILNCLIGEKMKKHHSSQECVPHYHLDYVSKIKPEQNQYHSMLNQSATNNAAFTNQYGLAGRLSAQGLIEKSLQTNSKQRKSVKQTDINQLQRALVIPASNHSSKQPSPSNRNLPLNNLPLTHLPAPLNLNLQSDIYTQANTNLFRSPSPLLQPSRDEDILQHKKVSNVNYLIRQVKQLLQLVRMEWLQREIQQSRSDIIKLQIQCRRLRICLRGGGSSGSKMKSERKGGQNRSTTAAMLQYGYAQRAQSKSPLPSNHRQTSLSKNSKHGFLSPRHSKQLGSNLIKVESNIKKNEYIETILVSQIQKQRVNLSHLMKRQQQLNTQIQAALQKYRTKSKGHRTLKTIPSSHPVVDHKTNNDEIETEETFHKKIQIYDRDRFRKDTGYRELLVEKRIVIKETLDKFRYHYEYKANKVQQENMIMREQLKIVQSKIYEQGMEFRPRTKNSISSQKNLQSQKKSQKPVTRKLASNQPQPLIQKIQGITSSKSRRKLLLRSPSSRASNPQVQAQIHYLRRIGSQQVLPSNDLETVENVESITQYFRHTRGIASAHRNMNMNMKEDVEGHNVMGGKKSNQYLLDNNLL